MRRIAAVLLLIVIQVATSKSADYLPVPATHIVKHAYYTLSYNEEFEQANWVYYTLTDSMVLKGGLERSNKFKMDKLVVTGSARSADYTKSGYDRGHLCPAADMGFNQVAMEESFLMSNISPQIPDFNRGIWKELETTVRRWAKKECKLFIVAGPVFKNNKGSIGKEEVLVPGYFYKVIYDATDEPKLIAFVFPNAGSDRPLTDFAVTTDEVEQLTGCDFFSQLPDKLESDLEGKVELSGWFEEIDTNSPVAQHAQEREKERTSDKYFYLILTLIILLVVIYSVLKGRRRKRR